MQANHKHQRRQTSFSVMGRSNLSQISLSKTIGRLAALGLLLLSSLGPWFADAHPATEATCTAPLVWLGEGHCACLVSLIKHYRQVNTGSGFLWWLGLPPLLPILFTLLLFLGRNHRLLWYFHLAGWFLVAIYSLFCFIIGGSWLILSWPSYKALFLWGAGLCGAVAVSLLIWEIRTGKRQPD
jgi:hypothetical protein